MTKDAIGKEEKKMLENIKDSDNNQTTYLDAEIAALEARLPDLEAERTRLLAGQVAIPGLGGSAAAIHLDVSQYIGIEDRQQRNQELQALLTDSPVFQGLVDGYRSKQELTREMVIAGVLPAQALALDARAKARISSHKLGEQTGQGLARILPKLSKWAKSPWLLLLGLLLLILWGGAWFLHLATSGGGNSVTTAPAPNNKGVITSTATPTVTKNGIQTTQAAPQSQSLLSNKVAYNYYYYSNDIMKMPMADETVSSVITTSTSSTPTPTVINDNDKTTGLSATQSASPSTSTAITTPTPTTATPAPTSNTPAPVVTGQQPSNADNYNRVGQPPTDLGGLNGPHGAFLAPSRLSVPALSVDVTVQKALVQEQIITPTTNTATISTTTMSASGPSPSPSPTQTQPQVQQVGVAVVWPRPGEVLHIGAYPGEIGNCIILGTQVNLAPLRRLEQNDIIKLYDRDKNVYSYRVLAFSATGQPERSVNPAWQGDNWIMQPDTQGQALLTIVVSMPQPLPPFDPNANAGAATTNSTGVDGQGQTAYKDDFTSPLKLAYRAVLVAYTPVQATPGATPVPVTGQVWQTQPMPQLQLEATSPTPASVPTPTPKVQSPYPSVLDPKEQNFLLELIRRAAAAARSGTTLLPPPSIPTTPTPGR